MVRHSDVFADANTISAEVSEDSSDVVKLTESAKVLDLLLSIIYRFDRSNQDLRCADFEVLNAVAEAAEKYDLHMASTCEVYMRCAILRPSHRSI
jgi:hypothetical protein